MSTATSFENVVALMTLRRSEASTNSIKKNPPATCRWVWNVLAMSRVRLVYYPMVYRDLLRVSSSVKKATDSSIVSA